jgi:uncharacterized protein YggU (UPF0235/DUF167 family)
VTPGAASPGIVGRHGNAWKVRVSAAPERGAANRALVSLLARELGLARSDVRLVSGHGAREKIVELTGLSAHDLDVRLSSAAGRIDQR